MGIVPPSLIPSWKRETQPKDERPPLQGYGDQLEGYSGERQSGQSNVDEQAALDAGIKLAEKRAQVIRMMQYGLEYSEIYMAPVAQLAEELGIPPVLCVDRRLIGEDQR